MGNYLSTDVEVELDFDEEGFEVTKDLDKKTNCPKKSEHAMMIPRSALTLESLPPLWRIPELLANIIHTANKTMKINVPYVSKERPKKYILSKFKGKKIPAAAGTGTVDINAELMRSPPIPCPFKNCKEGPPGHEVTPFFYVRTARHVVFDDSEAEHATLEFFCDHEGANVVKGHVYKVEVGVTDQDLCVLKCVSHDLGLFRRIMDESPVYRNPPPPRYSSPRPPLVVIVSHPHGCYKRISLGEWVGYGGRQVVDERRYQINARDQLMLMEVLNPTLRVTGFSFNGTYCSPEMFLDMERRVRNNPNMTMGELTGHYAPMNQLRSTPMEFITYTAPTCPGSSGAMVFVFFESQDGDWGSGIQTSHFRIHGERNGKFVNSSGQAVVVQRFAAAVERCKDGLCGEERKLPF